MQKIITYIYKALRKITLTGLYFLNHIITWILFYSNNVKFKKFNTKGIPYVSVAIGGSCIIKSNLSMNNGNLGNPIGRPQKCIFFVDKGAKLEIGANVGISSAAIIAHNHIKIGDYVKIGGGVCIYDTDFHSLESSVRNDKDLDFEQKKSKPVFIENNVFIGAHSTILKGIVIGENSIIGACSVVTKNVPANEIWAGNPARFIKKLNGDD